MIQDSFPPPVVYVFPMIGFYHPDEMEKIRHTRSPDAGTIQFMQAPVLIF
jgi:hypothetical protein